MGNLILKTKRQHVQGKRSARESSVISRGSIAHFTARGLLIDQPRSKFENLRFSAVIAALAATLLVFAPIRSTAASGSDLSTWISSQRSTSIEKMMLNISRPDVKPGVVIASPEMVSPNYFFHWVRDAALVMDVVVRAEMPSLRVERREHMMDEYIEFSRENQATPTLTGLGEPKFYVDGRGFDGPWGRPQNDGPALRALVLSRYAKELLDKGNVDYVTKKLYGVEMPARSVIKIDLEYVAHNWRTSSFDIWEELKGDHFYTRMVEIAALREGAKIADRLGDPAAAYFYNSQADAASATLSSFWDEKNNFIHCTINRTEGVHYKGNLDTQVILGVLHSDKQEGEFTVLDPRVMATAQRLEETFGELYAINRPGRFPGAGVAIGRYPEDVYSGSVDSNVGHAWFLTTASLAELNYKIATKLETMASFDVTVENLDFVRSALKNTIFLKGLKAGTTLRRENGELTALSKQLVEKGDSFLRRVRIHVGAGGRMDEQFDRENGFMRSAHDLTWSYASFITATGARPATARP